MFNKRKDNRFSKPKKTFDQLCVETIDILNIIQSTISKDTDIVWTSYGTISELEDALNNYIERINKKDITVFKELSNMFGPAAPFQELSISNGWGHEFLDIAAKYDAIYAELTSF